MTSAQTWSNVGPLTTLFVPAPTCAGNFLYSSSENHASLNIFASDCYPSKFGAGAAYYYSPGLCPSGWYSAYDFSRKYYGVPTLVSGESAVLCCPSGYVASLTAIPPPRLSQAICTSTLTGPVTARSCGICTSSFVVKETNLNGSPITAIAFTLLVRWQSSDVPILAAASTVRASTTSLPVPGIMPVDPSAPSPAHESKHLGGLSTGAKVGIGVGTCFGVILSVLICAYIILWCKRKRWQATRKNAQSSSCETTVIHNRPAKLDTNSKVVYDARNIYSEGLDPDSDQIRLLKIFPSRSEDIECDLQIHKLSDLRDENFFSLSYRWGDEEPTEMIKISGHDFPVRPNLFQALLQLRNSTQPSLYWIDAICINQESSVAEKRPQLRLMGQIYHHAHKTYVWLGLGTNNSNKAIDHFNQPQFARASLALFRQDYGANRPEWDFFIQDILERAWFSRAWIVQECIMSQSLIVQCGSRSLLWNVFANIVDVIAEQSEQLSPTGTAHLWTARSMIDLRRRGITNDRQKNLGLWIDLFGSQKCTDPEDSILAFLGLAGDRSSPILNSLYDTKTYEEICIRAMQHCLNTPGDKDFVCAKPRWGLVRANLPSWVPDFQSHPIIFVPRNGWFDPESCSGFDASQSNLGHRYTGAVRQLVLASQSTSFYPVDCTTASTRKGPRYLAKFQGMIIDSLTHVGTALERNERRDRPSNMQAFIREITRTCLGEEHAESSRKNSPYPGSQSGETYFSALQVTLSFGIYRDKRLIRPEQAAKFTLDSNQAPQSDELTFRLGGYKPVYTENKRIGLVPRHAAVTDKICILFGCSLPLVVRDITAHERQKGFPLQPSQNIYKLIGPSYVHGIMLGEAMVQPGVRQEIITLK